ncbi:Hypothetical protein PBC10988_39910 [Planctomycetales bacterium 10988]|nr:Hypothetical protein PBC10988_39910 [Planctomycetales bacterium 10988]
MGADLNGTDTRRARLTDEQYQAVVLREASVVLSAGAGCGKTHVLTQRFLSHLEPQGFFEETETSLDRLVAITFTDKAAREMRQRIRDTCRQRVLEAKPEEVDHWLKLLRTLETARISTIHSFCGSILRANAVEARLDPHFGVLEPAQAQAVLSETMEDHLRELISKRDPSAIELAYHFDLRSLQDRIALLLDDHHHIDFDNWNRLTPDDLVKRWEDFYQQDFMPLLWQDWLNTPTIDATLKLLSKVSPEPGLMKERCDFLLESLRSLDATPPANAGEFLNQLIEHARVQGKGCKKAFADPNDYVEVKNHFSDLRDSVKDLCKQFQWNPNEAKLSAELGLHLLNVTGQIVQSYEKRKRELRSLDNNDLIGRAYQLLKAPHRKRLRERMSKSIRLLLVDEFQDTDPMQADLVRLLCGEEFSTGKLFLVGDRKQSIYRFRGADPRVFRGMREELPSEGHLPLTRNFRSQPAIIRFVNYLFARDLNDRTEQQGDGKVPSLLEYEPLVAHHPQVSPEPAVEFLWAQPLEQEQNDSDDENKERQRKREAEWLAKRLRQLLSDEQPRVRTTVEGKSSARPLEPGDVAILFRAMTNLSYYEPALREQGLDYYIVGGRAFYAQQEIYDVLNLLRTLTIPGDEISLVGVLRSPFFNLEDETLFWLARQGSLEQGMTMAANGELPDGVSSQQQERVLFAAKTLASLRKNKDRYRMAPLIQMALEMTGYDAALVTEFMGERKLANLQKLIDLARTFDRSGFLSIDDYIYQLTQFVSKQPKESPAATQPEASQVIRIMSIHQSKGLEFPCVVLPDLARREQPEHSAASFHPQLGPLTDPPTKDSRKVLLNGKRLYQNLEKVEAAAEHFRLFYVAATRAADYLLLSSNIKDFDKPEGSWMKLLADRFDLTTGKVLDLDTESWLADRIGPDQAKLPEVLVTKTLPQVKAKKQRRTLPIEQLAEAARNSLAYETPPLVRPLPPAFEKLWSFTVSRLEGTLEMEELEQERLDRQAAHLEGEVITRRTELLAMGTLMHAVLESWDYKDHPDLEEHVRWQAEQLALPGSPLPDIAAATELLRKFLHSPQAQALIQAEQRWTEVEFLLQWPQSAEGNLARQFKQPIQIRGTIDCLYQDQKKAWHVIDYKSNPFPPQRKSQLTEKYRLQLLLYGLAAEHLLGAAPSSLILYFLGNEQAEVIPWNDQMRAEANLRLGRAIHKLRNTTATASW